MIWKIRTAWILFSLRKFTWAEFPFLDIKVLKTQHRVTHSSPPSRTDTPRLSLGTPSPHAARARPPPSPESWDAQAPQARAASRGEAELLVCSVLASCRVRPSSSPPAVAPRASSWRPGRPAPSSAQQHHARDME